MGQPLHESVSALLSECEYKRDCAGASLSDKQQQHKDIIRRKLITSKTSVESQFTQIQHITMSSFKPLLVLLLISIIFGKGVPIVKQECIAMGSVVDRT